MCSEETLILAEKRSRSTDELADGSKFSAQLRRGIGALLGFEQGHHDAV